MMSAEEFARAEELMCRDMPNCLSCPFKMKKPSQCSSFVIGYPAEAVKRVELWWNEHKHEFNALIKILNENEGE